MSDSEIVNIDGLMFELGFLIGGLDSVGVNLCLNQLRLAQLCGKLTVEMCETMVNDLKRIPYDGSIKVPENNPDCQKSESGA